MIFGKVESVCQVFGIKWCEKFPLGRDAVQAYGMLGSLLRAVKAFTGKVRTVRVGRK